MTNENEERKKSSFFHELTHPDRKIVLRTRGGIDKQFLIIVVLLVAFGSVMVFSAGFVFASKRLDDSFYFIKRQLIYAAIGVLVMILLANIDYALLKRFALPIFIISYILLLIVLIPGIGITKNGATRWLGIGPVTLQPTEVAKFALILMLATYISFCSEKMRSFKYGILIPALITVAVCVAAA